MSTSKCILLGTGTSQGIPVIGCSCEVCNSDNPRDKRLRSSALICANDTNIVIDTGPDFRQQMLREQVHRIDGILLTHEHNDHIIGLDDIRPFNFMQKKAIPLFASKRVLADIKNKFNYIFADNKYPGAPSIDTFEIGKQPFIVENLEIQPVHYKHGRLPVIGYRIGDFAYITDIKSIEDDELDKLTELSNLVLSALHLNEHHSHFNLKEAIEFSQLLRPKQTYLTHLSHKMGTYNSVLEILPKNIDLAYDGLEIAISFD